MKDRLFIGSNGWVCAIDAQVGSEVWRTQLRAGVFSSTNREDVTVLLRDHTVYAGCNGHLFAISAESGEILWHNQLEGLGYNDISLAMEGVSVQYLQKVNHSHSSS